MTAGKSTYRGVLIGLGLFIGLWAMMAFAFSETLLPLGTRDDFYPRWYGAREMLEGRDPYDINLATEPEQDNRFHRIHQEEGPYRFLYPVTVTYILLPFWLLPFPAALSLWSGLQMLMLLGLPILISVQLARRGKPGPVMVVGLFSLLMYRYSVHSYLSGQFTIFTMACLILGWVLNEHDRPALAALALVGSTLRPEGMILTCVVLAEFMLSRSYRPVLIWLGLMAVIGVISLVHQGFWIDDYVNNIRWYGDNVESTWSAPEAFGIDALKWPFIGLVLAWGLWFWWQLGRTPPRYRLPWRLSVVMLVLLLTLTQSKDYTLVYALLPLWLFSLDRQSPAWTVILVLVLITSSRVFLALSSTWFRGFLMGQVLMLLVTAGVLHYYWWSRLRSGDQETLAAGPVSSLAGPA